MKKIKALTVGILAILTISIIGVGVYAYSNTFEFELAEHGKSSFSAATKGNSLSYAMVSAEVSGSSVSTTAYMNVAVFSSANAGTAISTTKTVTYVPTSFSLTYTDTPKKGTVVYLGGLRNYYGSALYGTWQP